MDKEKELKVVSLMIEKYCHGNHKTKGRELCKECAELLEYVKLRRSKCRYGDRKPFCSNCRTHCYKSDMREKIRRVMRYSGPRIIFRHPVLAVRHAIESKTEKRKLAKEAAEQTKKQ